MTTISKKENRVTHDGKRYRFVDGGMCEQCTLHNVKGFCGGRFPCCLMNNRTDGKTGNFQEAK